MSRFVEIGPGRHRPARLFARVGNRLRDQGTDGGFTMVELIVAFAALMILFTITATAVTAYLGAGSTVIASYNNTDELTPNLMILQRLIRSEVEPAPAVGGVPTPPFVTSTLVSDGPSTTGNSQATFYANIGDPNGPAKIVMASSTPTDCVGCKNYTSTFTLTQYPANSGTCPGVSSGTACTWSATGKRLITIQNVVNGQTNLPQASTPIFTYNTLNPTTTLYSPASAIANFASCTATTCLADNIQSIDVDLQVQTPGSTNSTPYEENEFVVYRLSSSSYLYNPLVG